MRAFMNYTGLANATGAPAMSVPLHWTAEGLPLGSQLLARPGDDRLLLELAYDLERARPWKARWAPLSVRFL
jgi:amidase